MYENIADVFKRISQKIKLKKKCKNSSQIFLLQITLQDKIKKILFKSVYTQSTPSPLKKLIKKSNPFKCSTDS